MLQTQLLCVQSNPQLLTLPQVLCVFGVSQSLGRVEGHITPITTCMMPLNQFNSDHFEHVAKFTVAGMHDYLPSPQHFSAICLTYIFDTLVNFLNLKVLTHISTTSHKWQLYCDLNVLYN